jgi:flagellar biosynthesis protein FliR
VGLAILLSLIVLPLQGPALRSAPDHLLEFAALAGSEALVGFTIGIVVSMVFHALEMAASLIGIQMGFGLGQVLDPMTGGQTGTIDQFYRVLVALVFFAMNGHHIVIQGLIHSFEVAPPGTADLTLIAGERVVPFFISLFVVAIRIALPVMGALMLTDVALGLVGRTVPQMNVLVVGFPVKIGVGLLVMVASLPFVIAFMAGVFGSALPEVNGFLIP